MGDSSEQSANRPLKVCLFGHFGGVNFGNEATLQAMLSHLRLRCPDAEVTCICTHPEVVAKRYNVAVVSMTGILFKPAWLKSNPLARLLRKVFIGIPSELYRWFEAFRVLVGKDVFAVPGTGLLTDAYGFISWGPLSVFKWTLLARLCGCRVHFVSVGAGPLYRPLSRRLIKWSLALAESRSFRDAASRDYLVSVGIPVGRDQVLPDLAFSLPALAVVRNATKERKRPVVGLGLMEYAGKLSVANPDNSTYISYLETLASFTEWLIGSGYDVRLLIGDISDMPVIQEFKRLLGARPVAAGDGRIIDEPVSSVEDLLSQIQATDLVVATRFHNLLLALALYKPVLAITFHHKCASLAQEFGISAFSQDIHQLDFDQLKLQFRQLEKDAQTVSSWAQQKADSFRRALDMQYDSLFNEVLASVPARGLAFHK